MYSLLLLLLLYHILLFLGFDSSSEADTLVATGTQAMVVEKTKARGRKPNTQDCNKGTTKSQTDSKIHVRKKPSQTKPCDGKLY